MGYDSEKGFSSSGVDPSWQVLLEQLSMRGFSEKDIENNKDFIHEFVKEQGGIEKVSCRERLPRLTPGDRNPEGCSHTRAGEQASSPSPTDDAEEACPCSTTVSCPRRLEADTTERPASAATPVCASGSSGSGDADTPEPRTPRSSSSSPRTASSLTNCSSSSPASTPASFCSSRAASPFPVGSLPPSPSTCSSSAPSGAARSSSRRCSSSAPASSSQPRCSSASAPASELGPAPCPSRAPCWRFSSGCRWSCGAPRLDSRTGRAQAAQGGRLRKACQPSRRRSGRSCCRCRRWCCCCGCRGRRQS